MNLSVWKFPLAVTDEQVIVVPDGATPLHVDVQDRVLCIWVLVSPYEAPAEQTIRIYGTGHKVDSDLSQFHVGTVLIGLLVWHVFWEAK